jgi:LemA protein
MALAAMLLSEKSRERLDEDPLEPGTELYCRDRMLYLHFMKTIWGSRMVGLIIFLVVVIIIVFWIIGIYNGLVKLRNLIKNSFSQIDVQLKRRYDLIPNLVETAKGYMKHERETLDAVIKARNSAAAAIKAVEANPSDPTLMKNLMGAEGQLGASLGRFNVAVEAYPELKADRTMTQIMEELTSTENKISFARQAFNDSVMSYNNQREIFPNSFIAGMFNFQAAQSFEIEDVAERQNVKVSFS